MAQQEDFRQLVVESAEDRARVRTLVANKQWQLAEPDRARLSRYITRNADTKVTSGAEAAQGNTIDFQPASFLLQGAAIQRAVGFVEVMAAGVSCTGSGFLISPGLFITNQHVIPDIVAARGAQVVFDRQVDALGRPMPTTTFLLDPDRCAVFSAENVLDYAIVAIGERTSGSADVSGLGFCPLSNRHDKHVIGMSLNIVQYPNGSPKLIAVRNNLLTYRTETTLLYETDTDHGSSGAPVFNDLWEVVALHHYGEPFLSRQDESGRPIPENVNEGVRISSIYNDLAARLAQLDGPPAALLRQALDYDKTAQTASGVKTLGPPRPSVRSAESALLGDIPMTAASSDEIKIVVPIEISIKVGGGLAAQPAVSVVEAVQTVAPKSLVRAAEKLRIDADYTNRNGYASDFIVGHVVNLPMPDAELAKQVGALRAGEANADGGVLKYEHFSLIMNRNKRVAMFTATNIDGATYLEVDRKSGKAKAAEGETWFNDPRVSESFFLGQDFYSAWSDYFDRGHLTRRSDPTWGTPEQAERANADTFHFTNCSPQHFLFNQSTNFWQGVERYVLEQGVLADDSRQHLCVFQGPIYSDAVDHWAEQVQIPSSFFKIVIWKGHDGRLKSVGLVVDQLALLDKKRFGVSSDLDAPVKVNQWRVKISEIAKRTGLKFDQSVVDADTIAQPGQPAVGEAETLIASYADIKLG